MTCAKDPDDGPDKKPDKKPDETRDVRRVYRGYVRLVRHTSAGDDPTAPTFLQALGSAFDEDCADDENDSLAQQLMNATARYGRRVRLRFVASDDRHSADPMDPFGTGWADSRGDLDAVGSTVAGPQPGVWVVRESIRVGTNDLLKALRALAGKFVHMEVTFLAAADTDKT